MQFILIAIAIRAHNARLDESPEVTEIAGRTGQMIAKWYEHGTEDGEQYVLSATMLVQGSIQGSIEQHHGQHRAQ